MKRKEKIRGIVASMPTPTKDNYEVDFERLEEHVEWLIGQGFVTGRAVLMGAGGLGEGYFLTREEHGGIMTSLAKAASGRVPTMVGIFESCTKEAVKRAKMAEDAGIDFVQVNPPHYTAPIDDEVYTHYKMINDNANVGIMIYNTPWSAMGYEVSLSLVERLLDLENLVGMKWASREPGKFIMMLKNFSEKMVIIDNSGLISFAFQLGARGYISLLGNVAPKAELYLLSLLEKGDFETFDKEHQRMNAWREVLGAAEEIGYRGVGEGPITKAIMEAVGKPMGPPLPPQRAVSKEVLERIRHLLQKNKVLSLEKS